MIKRILGKDLEVSAIGLGCMGLSQSYPPFPKKEEEIRFLRRAVEMGQTFFDTSEAYAVGEAVTEFAEKHSLAAAQVALAWLLHQKSFIVPIPGTKTESRLQENMSAAYVDLSDEDYKEVDRIIDGHTVIGARYSETTERLTDSATSSSTGIEGSIKELKETYPDMNIADGKRI